MATLKVSFSASHTLPPNGESTGASLVTLTVGGINVVTNAEVTSEDAASPDVFTYEVDGLDLSDTNTASFTLTNSEEGREVTIGYIRTNPKYDDGYYKGFYYAGNAPAGAVEKTRPESMNYTTTADQRAGGAPDTVTTWWLVTCGDDDYESVTIAEPSLWDTRSWDINSSQYFIRVAGPDTWE